LNEDGVKFSVIQMLSLNFQKEQL